MKANLMITNLSYEEIVLLQQIMIDIDEKGLFIEHDTDILDSLYEKVMNA
jgi:hypothetical protein